MWLKPCECAKGNGRCAVCASCNFLAVARTATWRRGSRPISQKRRPRLAQTAPIAEGTTRYVRRQTGRFPVEGTDATSVRLASETEAEYLALPEPTAVAVVLHTAHDQEGRPLVCEQGVTPGALYARVDTYAM